MDCNTENLHELTRVEGKQGEASEKTAEGPEGAGREQQPGVAAEPGDLHEACCEESTWIFEEEIAAEEDTWSPGPSQATVLKLSHSLATAFHVADIGIQLMCLQQELERTARGRRLGESLERYFDTLCHSVEQDDPWRVKNAIACLVERLRCVEGLGRRFADAHDRLAPLFERLLKRCGLG